MANKILILGSSGSGKSSSIKNLDHKETFIIKCLEKDLPFKNSRKKYCIEEKNIFVKNNPASIIKMLGKINLKEEVKTVIIDDSNYIMTYEYKRKAGEKGYGKFETMAFDFMDILDFVDSMRPNINVYFMAHTEKDHEGEKSFKSIGKFLSEKLVIEGLFTIVLLANGMIDDYKFTTNGVIPAKTPFEMFSENLIDNDLAVINETIKEYYEGDE